MEVNYLRMSRVVRFNELTDFRFGTQKMIGFEAHKIDTLTPASNKLRRRSENHFKLPKCVVGPRHNACY